MPENFMKIMNFLWIRFRKANRLSSRGLQANCNAIRFLEADSNEFTFHELIWIRTWIRICEFDSGKGILYEFASRIHLNSFVNSLVRIRLQQANSMNSQFAYSQMSEMHSNLSEISLILEPVGTFNLKVLNFEYF